VRYGNRVRAVLALREWSGGMAVRGGPSESQAPYGSAESHEAAWDYALAREAARAREASERLHAQVEAREERLSAPSSQQVLESRIDSAMAAQRGLEVPDSALPSLMPGMYFDENRVIRECPLSLPPSPTPSAGRVYHAGCYVKREEDGEVSGESGIESFCDDRDNQ